VSRFAVYGAVGLATELVFTRLTKGRARTSAWMFPVYGLARPLFEPAHERLRRRPVVARATAYGLGFLGVEYATGRIFRRFRGTAPWDYSYARRHFDGLIRPDFFPLWAVYGLALERVHDRLTRSPRLEFAGHDRIGSSEP
jgi:hypothetical protein